MPLESLSERLAREALRKREGTPVQKPAEKVYPKLGLSGIEVGKIPRLEVVVKDGNSQVISNVETDLISMIVSPSNQVLYLEAACPSDAGAHALMGCVTDLRGSMDWRFFAPGAAKHADVAYPDPAVCSDHIINIPGFVRNLHHVAIMDSGGDLLISTNNEELWLKLREHMTCPTLEEWGTKIMPKMMRSGVLMECESFGLPAGYIPYVLAPDAEVLFDKIVCDFVRSIGGIRKRTVVNV